MYYVYILQSIDYPYKVYIGRTDNEPHIRLKQHNSGGSQYTRKYKPWRLVYFEAYLDRKDALRRERMLKQYGNSLGILKKRITNSIKV